MSFRTDALSMTNYAGKRICAYLDSPLYHSSCVGVALIAPAYGETKENSLLISAHFAANGYCGLRFDWTDHVGESDGDIFTSTLSKMRADLKCNARVHSESLQRMQNRHWSYESSCSCGTKVAANDQSPDFLICFTPVVDLQGTLTMVYREDLVASFRKGKRYGTLNILGFSIDADGFLRDSIEMSFADIWSTQTDASRIKSPTFFVLGQRDSWVRTTDAQTVLVGINSEVKESLVLPKMLHRLLEILSPHEVHYNRQFTLRLM